MKPQLIPCILLLAGCAQQTATDDPFDARDPIRPFNEKIFAFNLAADKYVIRPTAKAYHHLPDWTRGGIGNFLTNLSEPENAVNFILQLNPKGTFTATWRFILNSTFGMGGLRDFAGENGGLKYMETDFGETLGHYGVAQGPYVVLPIEGPSTVRDTAGFAFDWFADPVGYVLNTPGQIAQSVAEGIATRDDQSAIIDQLYYQSLDPYTASRAAYIQHQDAEQNQDTKQ
jgi:phospholipid-binding lipoprotein MlaA